MLAICFPPPPNPRPYQTLPARTSLPASDAGFRFSRRSFAGVSSVSPRTTTGKKATRSCSRILSSSNADFKSLEALTFDVVVVGAGIIGLTIARQLLLGSGLSVAVVDARVPCSGATGAGQGYIWMAHKTPGSDEWDLALRSKQLWEDLAHDIQKDGMDPFNVLGWKKTGSLLVGRTAKESMLLQGRVKLLSEAGMKVELLSSTDLHWKEPVLKVNKEGGGAFLPDDCQLDAHRAVSFIEKVNRSFFSHGRYVEFYNEPAIELIRKYENGKVEAVHTSKHVLYSKKAVVIATGAWSGHFMQNMMSGSNDVVDIPVKPRKGHLLVLENFQHIQLNHGLMEVGYMDHQVPSSLALPSVVESGDHEEHLTSISMTATMDFMGKLVLGSSRQFVGFNTDVEESIISHIWERAGEFFPTLKQFSIKELSSTRQVRIGLRPYMPDGKPVIGPVQRLPNVLLATGHEGSGLTMALGTAEMIVDMVLGQSLKVNCETFSPQGGC